MIDHTGWTWCYVEDHLDLHRHAALQRRWRRYPPLQQMVQAFMGIDPGEPDPQPDAPPPPLQDEEAAIERFCRNFAAAGGTLS